MKYLIFGLGNIGDQYENTRHNIGFDIIDFFANQDKTQFELDRHAFVAETKFKGRKLVLIKPTTFMNRSGKAVQYWMQKENVDIDKILVIVDDLALDFGVLRMRKKGGDGNHNGLSDIINTLGRNDFARLRFGIGSDFRKGFQSDYVLGKWSNNESKLLLEKIDKSVEIIQSFTKLGVDRTMNLYNNK